MRTLSFNVGQYDSSTVFTRDLNAAALISPGCHVRLDAVWRYLSDPSGTKYNFSALDAKVDACTARGLRVTLMMPMWCPDQVLAGKPDKTQIKTTAALNGFVAFAKALGQHYGSDTTVHCLATGNEPNLKNPFAPDGADPLWQAKVTNAVFPVLPTTWKIYSPGMAPASTGNGYMSPYDYLSKYWPALTVPLHGCEIHPYGRAADVSQSWSVLGALTKIHNLVKVPIVASEYNSDWNDSDTNKAINVPLGLTYMKGLGFVERVFIYSMSDKSTDSTVHLGIFDGSGNERPLYNAVKTWAAVN